MTEKDSLATQVFGVMAIIVIVCGSIAVGYFLLQPNPSIHDAVEQGDFAKVQELIEQGTPVDQLNKYGSTPLSVALSHGSPAHIEISQYLVEKGADVKIDGILESAIRYRDLVFIQDIINRGAIVDSGDLAYAVSSHPIPDQEVLDLLLANGADINARVSGEFFSSGQLEEIGGYTALHLAVYHRDLSLVKYLVSKGADVNVQAGEPHSGTTPLYLANTGYRNYVEGNAGIYYYVDVPSSPEIVEFLKSEGAR